MPALTGYSSRFDPAKGWGEIKFRAGNPIQAAELNELQQVLRHRHGVLGNTIYRQGQLIQGGGCAVDRDGGTVTCAGALLWIKDGAYQVPGATFETPMDVLVGVWLTESDITELDDPELKCQVPWASNYGRAGAARSVIGVRWGWEGDGGTGEFFPVHRVISGLLAPPPATPDRLVLEVSRYDRESTGGSYLVRGMDVVFLGAQGGAQVYGVRRGVARVEGRQVTLATDRRLPVAVTPDLREVTGDPAIFLPGGDGKMRVTLRHPPVVSLDAVRGTKSKTVTITRGGFAGGVDQLPDASVIQVTSVSQGETTYTVMDDWVLSADAIDWSPAGSEPAPGSSYSVTYRYRLEVTPEAWDETGYTVSDLVSGTVVEADYRYALPRLDRLVLLPTGGMVLVPGVSSGIPKAPPVPRGVLSLATVAQTWYQGQPPSITPDAVRMVPMSELGAIQRDISDLYKLVALEQLKSAAMGSSPDPKLGLFVDAFKDDSQRDLGIAQTAAIVDGELMLPITASCLDVGNGSGVLLDYTSAVILEQTRRTSAGYLVNPFKTAGVMPRAMTLSPTVDGWVDQDTASTSLESGVFVTGQAPEGDGATVREREITFSVFGCGLTETIATLAFDGVPVTPQGVTSTADNQGTATITGTFTIPAGVPAGVKEVSVTGSQGNFAYATYVADGLATDEPWQTAKRVTYARYALGGIAQTFTLSEGRYVSGVDLWFVAKGSGDVWVHIQEVEDGVPVGDVVWHTGIAGSAIATGGWYTKTFSPVWLEGGRAYALVIYTADLSHKLAVSQVGQTDTTGATIGTNPIAGGFFSSADNIIWTAYQDIDLAFRLYGATFSGAKTVTLGTVTAAQMTDLLPLVEVERPASGTDVALQITLPGGEVIETHERALTTLDEAVDGDVTLAAVLTGTSTESPAVYPGGQLLAGALGGTGTYVSRALTAGTGVSVAVTLEALTPGASGVTAALQGADASWQEMGAPTSQPVGDGWQELTFTVTPFTADTTRLRLTLTGTPAARPRARALRVIVT